MKTKTIYLADDGKEFASREECGNYERQLEETRFSAWIVNHEVEMWNNQYEPQTKLYENYVRPYGKFKESAFSTVKFLIIRSEEALHAVIDHCEEEGYSAPSQCGEWVYDEDHDRWTRPSEYYNTMAKEVDFCRSVGLLLKAD